ncbi:hypothetical protein ACQ4PT_069151 [Festuca glaucescens]
MAAPAGDSSGGDRYRSHLAGEGEKNTVWRHGAPPTYDAVNSLFESGRTQEWLKEETVQNAIKTWEMELSHKARLGDFKSVSPGRFTLSVNGGPALTGEEPDPPGHRRLRRRRRDLRVLARPLPLRLPARLRPYKGHMEGPYKGHAPTGDKVQFYGVAVLKVDEQLRAEDVEVFYDPGELLAGLIKGAKQEDAAALAGRAGPEISRARGETRT